MGAEEHVAAVTVAAHLDEARAQARLISLEAMNAKALVTRAGHDARIFQPITEFMTAAAREVEEAVAAVDRASSQAARASLVELRAREALRRFEARAEACRVAPHGASVADVIERVRADVAAHRVATMASRGRLVALLEGIEQKMRAALVVTNTTRVEAANSGAYRAQFESVAHNLEQATHTIRARAKDGLRMLAASAAGEDE